MQGSNVLYLDTGTLINILATGYAADIIQAQPYICAITEQQQDDKCIFWAPPPHDGKTSEQTDTIISMLADTKTIEIHQCNYKQYIQTYTQFSFYSIPPQKASLLTLVTTQGASLASDDRRTRNILRNLAPQTILLSTLTLLENWQKTHNTNKEDIKIALYHLQHKAQFIPLENDPHISWWYSIINYV